MNIELKEITVRQLTNGYQDNEEGGTATAATTTAATTTTNQKESYEINAGDKKRFAPDLGVMP